MSGHGNRRRGRRVGWARSSGDGCISWLVTCVATLILLWFNVALVRLCFAVVAPMIGGSFKQPHVEQAFVLALPAALLFLQWWCWEIAAEWLWPDEPPDREGRRSTG